MLTQYQECIDACYLCATACDNCAASCLKEENLEMMRDCIRLDMQCANICRLSAQFMALDSESAKKLCAVCAEICQQCGDECGKHQHDHCQQCAKACHACAEACRKMAA
ncbi:four-helix bundle copper-binding protein [Erwinia sp. MMLR14_017]|uniref:four-helix bundle copper-binding protein n=1 Tax=Erwinia sp. MMLR14_017 TaxID=3093842 RepID=UPI00299055DA|nr:four-helix bundle copper-binding protein [Erwinia sp. MMLR14_017]MDW8845995.1 four-helix bundle copper-binding protein [Erwinia sp. MMLR14_017]